MVKNCKQQPFVPLGVLLTSGAVFLAAKSLRAGQRKDAQRWFRYRVAFQGMTIVALVAGGWYYGNQDPGKRREQEEILREKAKVREKLWIEELERRDQEAKDRLRRAELARKKRAALEETEKKEDKK